MKEELFLKFDEETQLHTCKWTSSALPKGIIIIAHGMAEHIERYDEFGETLANEGYIVYGASHYGHGKSCKGPAFVGLIEKYDFIEAIVKSIKIVYEHAMCENENNLPAYLFAHSMGSMVSQEYIQLYPNDFKKVILSGTDVGSIKYSASKILTKIIMVGKEKNYCSDFVESLSNGQFDKKYQNERKHLGWLSANPENINKYEQDPFCGIQYPVSFYNSLSKSLCRSAKNKNIKKIKADKILIISGAGDPVSNFGKSVTTLSKKYSKNNINNETMILANARHEMMNESEEVKKIFYDKIISFLDN